MVFGDVEQDADRRIERGREIDLIGRHFDHVHAARRAAARATGSRCRYCRRAGRRSRPSRSRCAISAVVVDLPLVPVMATNGASGAWRRRSRQNSSMSPITSTAAARASPTVQCGAGCVSGTPGASTSAAIFDQSTCRRSAVGNAGAASPSRRCRRCRPSRRRRRRRRAARWRSPAPSRRGRTRRPSCRRRW